MPGAGRLLVRVHGRTHSSLLRVVSLAISISRWQHRGGRSREDGFVEAVGSCRSDHVPVFDRRSLGRHTHASSSSRLPKASRTCGSSKSSRSIRRLSPRAIRVDSVCVGKSVLRADRARLTRPSRARRLAGGCVAFPRRVERDHASRADVCLCRRRGSPRRHESEPTCGDKRGPIPGAARAGTASYPTASRAHAPRSSPRSTGLNIPRVDETGAHRSGAVRISIAGESQTHHVRIAAGSQSRPNCVAVGDHARSLGRRSTRRFTSPPIYQPSDLPALRFTTYAAPTHHLSDSPAL